MHVDGACYCGYLTFKAEVDPDTVAICNCTDCQKLSATAFRVVPTTARPRARMSDGHRRGLRGGLRGRLRGLRGRCRGCRSDPWRRRLRRRQGFCERVARRGSRHQKRGKEGQLSHGGVIPDATGPVQPLRTLVCAPGAVLSGTLREDIRFVVVAERVGTAHAIRAWRNPETGRDFQRGLREDARDRRFDQMALGEVRSRAACAGTCKMHVNFFRAAGHEVQLTPIGVHQRHDDGGQRAQELFVDRVRHGGPSRPHGRESAKLAEHGVDGEYRRIDPRAPSRRRRHRCILGESHFNSGKTEKSGNRVSR